MRNVPTEADERVETANEHITKAVSELHKVLIEECPGSEDYADKYKKTLYDVYAALALLKGKLLE